MFEIILLLVLVFIIPVFIYNWNALTFSKKELIKKNKIIKEFEKEKNKEYTDFKYSEDALKFIDKLIQSKYNYHLYTTLLPVYLDKKIPEKKMIETVKEKIYVSIVGGLTRETKKSILRFFTEKGIEIYINEKIIVLMNETDFRNAGKFTEGFRDLNPSKMDSLIP